MSFIITILIYFGILFALFFISKRHIGMPALGLTAGAILAKLWTDELTPIVAQSGVVIERPPLESVVAIGLTLLPAFIVLARSNKSHSMMHRVYSSIVFAALSVMLTYASFSSAVQLDSASKEIVLSLLPYDAVIITVCIVLALVDVVYHRKRAIGSHK